VLVERYVEARAAGAELIVLVALVALLLLAGAV
jgi:hypothetical protein